MSTSELLIVSLAKGAPPIAPTALAVNGGFIEHYILALIYPTGLTPDIQLVLGAVVVAINVAVYGWLIRRYVQA